MNRFDEIKKEIENAGKNKATKKEMKDNISKVIELVDEKVSLKEVQAAITEMQNEVASKFLKVQD